MLLLNRWKRGSERKLVPPPLKLGVRIVMGARGPAAKLLNCAACEAVVTTSATTAIAVETDDQMLVRAPILGAHVLEAHGLSLRATSDGTGNTTRLWQRRRQAP
jgi:hypothetical protein